jgi:hypothetical protein
MEAIGHPHVPATLPLGKKTRHSAISWPGGRGETDRFEAQTNLMPLAGFKFRIIQPTFSRITLASCKSKFAYKPEDDMVVWKHVVFYVFIVIAMCNKLRSAEPEYRPNDRNTT